MFKKARRTLVELRSRGVSRLGAICKKFYIKVAKFLSSSSLLTTKPVFSDPGVSFGGLSGRLLSSSTFMEPSDYCDVNFPVDRFENNVALGQHLSSLRLSSMCNLGQERHIPDPFAEAVGL